MGSRLNIEDKYLLSEILDTDAMLLESDDLNFYKDRSEMFNLKGLLNMDEFIKINDIQEISNPIFFNANKMPTSDGLLSNEIFGITREERASRFGYINLGGKFLHPLVYKIWSSVDRNIKSIVHGVGSYKIDSNGTIVEDPEGETGLSFLEKNISKIKIKRTDSVVRERIITFLNKNKNNLFVDKFLVIPAFYRDVNTENGKMGVGDINKLYNNIIICSRSIRESSEYGLTLINAQMGRMQELLLSLYNYFGSGNPDMQGAGVGMPGKLGIIRRANISKTTDYSSRLVISAPELKVEDLDDLDVDMDYTLVPLASICVNFLPFMIFAIRRFFENNFSSLENAKLNNVVFENLPKGVNPENLNIINYQITFSDDRIKKELDRFVHGISNRFIPIEVPFDNPKVKGYLKFRGRGGKESTTQKLQAAIIDRPLTWCDIFYQAAVEITTNKHILITRYPIDSFYNQFPTRIRVASTIDTEYMVVSGAFGSEDVVYPKYPKIRKEDLLTNTSNKFVDTLNMCNGYLPSIGGDYDGDQVTVKGIYSDEANAELEKQLNSKIHYIGLGGETVMEISKEGVQSLYCLTLSLPDARLTDPIF